MWVKRGIAMTLAFIADIAKRQLVQAFCYAYRPILCKHRILATDTTASWIESAANLKTEHLLSLAVGGAEQVLSAIERNEVDLCVIFYHAIAPGPVFRLIQPILAACDRYMIPTATNIATAEVMVLGLDRGDYAFRAAPGS